MSLGSDRRACWLTWILILVPPLILLAAALRPGYVLLPAQLPYLLDPLWKPLAPAGFNANPVLGDQFYQYHAWKVALWQNLAHGQVPWWIPAINGGQPLIANGQAGLFDPFNLVGMLFPLATSYVVGALARLWVVGLFTYAYARTIGLSRLAAWLAMLVFTFSGPLVSWLGATPSHVFVWLPALLWIGEKVLTTRRLGWALAASGVVALLLFCSQPEIALQVGIVWGIYLLIRATWLEGGFLRGLHRHAKWWILIVLLGSALAAVEVLPFAATLRQSIVFVDRVAAPPFHFIPWLRQILTSWQEWPTLVTTLLPNFLGREQDGSYWYPTGNTIENNAYAGVLPLLLALLALWLAWRNKESSERRWIALWGGTGLCAIALAVELPLFKGLNALPPLNLLEPGRYRTIYLFAVAILAGFGLDFLRASNCLTQQIRRPFLLLLTGAALLNILLVAAAYVGFTHFAADFIASGRAYMQANAGSPLLDRPLAELYALVDARQQAKLAMLRPSNPVMYLPLLVAVTVALLLWFHHRRRISMSVLASSFVAVAWLDLMWTGYGINSVAPTTLLESTPAAIAYLHSQAGSFRVAGTQLILNPNMSMITHLEDVRGYDPMARNRYLELLSGLDGFTPIGYHSYFSHLNDARLDLFNVAYGLSRRPPTDPRWQAVFADAGGVTVYHSRSALPRAYLVYDAEIVGNPQQSLDRTLDASFDPRRSVVLEERPTGWQAPAEAPSQPPQVEVNEDDASIVYVAVDSPLPAILVLLDTYDSGWRASVDQQAATIYAANHAFRAVVLPAGRHTVTFTYTPPWLALGAAISAAAILVVTALLVWMLAAKRREAVLR